MMSITEVRERYENGEKCTDVIQEFLERIREGRYNSFITITEDTALEQAERVDRGEADGVLAGIPVAVKDSISTEGIRTTCASRILENYVPPFDAYVVRRIKEEGGIIVGKTNMDEFCMGTTTETSYFGPVKNPLDPDYVPGGSSGGSAAAIRAGEAILALGSDTGGSVRCPSSFCGVTGIKPTYGLVSRYGLIPYANSLEQIGPMASNVRDAALFLEVIAGKDPDDSTSVDRGYRFSEVDCRGMTVGVLREMLDDADERVRKYTWKAVEKLEEYGISWKDVSMPYMKHALAGYYVIATSEASSNLSRYDGVRYGLSMEGEMDWNTYFSKVRGMGFGEEVKRRIILGTYALSAGYYGKYYLKALKVRRLIINEFNRIFKEVDAIVAPTMPVLPFRIGEIQDPLSMYLMDVNTVPVNLAGLPAISVPAGKSGKFSVGVQIIGKAFDENTIINLAMRVEDNGS